jgi:hypothetical protein
MKRPLLLVVMLMTGFAITACGMLGVPVPCYQNDDEICDLLEEAVQADMVCNMAVPLSEACEELLEIWPLGVPTPLVCREITPDLGTCNAIGVPAHPCAEDDDCVNTCDVSAGFCL